MRKNKGKEEMGPSGRHRTALPGAAPVALAALSLLACVALLPAGAAAAEAPLGLWKSCPTGAAAGQCRIPRGIGADPNLPGHLYVADQSNHRINEFTAWGLFVKTWGWNVAEEGAAGSGNLTGGSATIGSVTTTSKAFHNDQPIAGAGIAPGTAIKSLGAGTITLSKPATASGAGVALSVAESPDNVPVNERQKVTIGGGPTGGTFTLTFTTPNPSPSSATATGIPFDAAAAAVQAKLEALSNVGSGNVEVSGSNGGPWTVEFKGTRFADTNVEQMGAAGAGLTPSGTAGVETTRQGATGPEVCKTLCQTGQLGSGAGQLSAPEGMAVDSEGDVYVAEFSNRRVQKFDSEGHFLLMFGGEVNKTTLANRCTKAQLEASQECGIGTTGAANGQFGSWAVGSFLSIGSGDTVYVGDQERIQEFDKNGEYLKSLPVAGTVQSLAVEPESSPTDLYVALNEKPNVLKLAPTGASLCSIEVEKPAALASAASGGVYIVDHSQIDPQHTAFEKLVVRKFDPACSEVEDSSAPIDLKVDGFTESTGIATGSACLTEGADVYVANSDSEQKLPARLRPAARPPAMPARRRTAPPRSTPSTRVSVGPRRGRRCGRRSTPTSGADATYYVQYGTGGMLRRRLRKRPASSAARRSRLAAATGGADRRRHHQRRRLPHRPRARDRPTTTASSPRSRRRRGPVARRRRRSRQRRRRSQLHHLPARRPNRRRTAPTRPSAPAPRPTCPTAAPMRWSPRSTKNGGDIVALLEYHRQLPAALEPEPPSAASGSPTPPDAPSATRSPAPYTSQYIATRHAGRGLVEPRDLPAAARGRASSSPRPPGSTSSSKPSRPTSAAAGCCTTPTRRWPPARSTGFPNLYRRDNCGGEDYEALITAAEPPNRRRHRTTGPSCRASRPTAASAVFPPTGQADPRRIERRR